LVQSRTGLLWSFLILLASAHAAVAYVSTREKSTTSDEIAHVTGGYAFNHWNDYRLHPENGLLPQRWAALPATFAEVKFPDMATPAWARSNVWEVGFEFFYHSGNPLAVLLGGARAMNTVWGAATILLVAWWSLRLFGPVGAMVSALFAAACPTLLAHSPLATSDMAMCFFMLASLTLYWRHLNERRIGLAIASCLVFGLACVAKYTAVLLPLMMVILAAVRLGSRAPLELGNRTYATLGAKAGMVAATLGAHAIVGYTVIWLFCGLRYAAFNPALPGGEFHLPWQEVLAFGGWKAQILEACRNLKLLPEAFIYGFAFVVKFSLLRGAFLDGEYSLEGWLSFFPKTFLYKTPPSLIALIVAALVVLAVWLRQRGTNSLRDAAYRVAPLVVLFVVYWVVSLASNLNIGHRHILPTYPVLYIFCGAVGWAVHSAARRPGRAGWAMGGALLMMGAWHVGVAARIHPHHLAYFSPVIGGPEKGYRHLVDSSLDWGQDLPGLKRWLDANTRPGEPVYLSYFGNGSPEFEGISATLLPQLPDRRPKTPHALQPGVYAIGATMLQHVYSVYQGPWTIEREQRFQSLRAVEATLVSPDKPSGPDDPTPEQWAYAWSLYEPLRFARLCHYLRARRPDAMVGYSILVYRLDAAELHAAVGGDLKGFAAALERLSAQNP
jgi:hypothetical protein